MKGNELAWASERESKRAVDRCTNKIFVFIWLNFVFKSRVLLYAKYEAAAEANCICYCQLYDILR